MKILSANRLQASIITPDQHFEFKKYRWLDTDIVDSAAMIDEINGYTLLKMSQFTLVYSSETGELNGVFTYKFQVIDGKYNTLAVDFIANKAVLMSDQSADILYSLLTAGTIFGQRYTGMSTEPEITATTFNAYTTLLDNAISDHACFLTTQGVNGPFIRLNIIDYAANWQKVCKGRTFAKNFLLYISSKIGRKSDFDLVDMTFDEYLASQKHRKSGRSGTVKIGKLFKPLHNKHLDDVNWLELLNSFSCINEPRYDYWTTKIVEPDLQKERDIVEFLRRELIVRRKYIVRKLDKKDIDALLYLAGAKALPGLAGSKVYQYSKMLKDTPKTATTLFFYLIITPGARENMISRHFLKEDPESEIIFIQDDEEIN